MKRYKITVSWNGIVSDTGWKGMSLGAAQRTAQVLNQGNTGWYAVEPENGQC